jgi:hypothetical protein
MPEVTQILSRIEAGDPSAAEQLLPLLYDELKKLAAHKIGPYKLLQQIGEGGVGVVYTAEQH